MSVILINFPINSVRHHLLKHFLFGEHFYVLCEAPDNPGVKCQSVCFSEICIRVIHFCSLLCYNLILITFKEFFINLCIAWLNAPILLCKHALVKMNCFVTDYTQDLFYSLFYIVSKITVNKCVFVDWSDYYTTVD